MYCYKILLIIDSARIHDLLRLTNITNVYNILLRNRQLFIEYASKISIPHNN